MRAKLIHERGEKTFALVFDLDDEVVASLTGFANIESHQLPDAVLTEKRAYPQ